MLVELLFVSVSLAPGQHYQFVGSDFFLVYHEVDARSGLVVKKVVQVAQETSQESAVPSLEGILSAQVPHSVRLRHVCYRQLRYSLVFRVSKP